MKKNRVLVLLMSAFAVSPALLGTARAVEVRSANAEIFQNGAVECPFNGKKHIESQANANADQSVEADGKSAASVD